MGRLKNKRNLSFKPIYKSFVPEDKTFEGVVKLLDEEIEAIYLMDVKNLYQEDAAKMMEVSRPTFTRILKTARQKLATGIISGSKILIEDSLDFYIIALCSNDESLKSLSPLDRYIFIYKLEDEKLEFIKKCDNPAYMGKEKVAMVLPECLLQNNVNIFIGSKVGEGLKNSLLSKGIDTQIRSSIDMDNFAV